MNSNKYLKKTDYDNYKNKLEKLLFNHTHYYTSSVGGGVGGLNLNLPSQSSENETSVPMIKFRKLVNGDIYDPNKGWTKKLNDADNFFSNSTNSIGPIAINSLNDKNMEKLFDKQNDFLLTEKQYQGPTVSGSESINICEGIINIDNKEQESGCDSR